MLAALAPPANLCLLGPSTIMPHPVPLPLSITRTPACLPACLQVLEQLLEENDQDPNVWLLLAICYQGGGDLEAALEAGQRKGTHTHAHARTCSAGWCTCALHAIVLVDLRATLLGWCWPAAAAPGDRRWARPCGASEPSACAPAW